MKLSGAATYSFLMFLEFKDTSKNCFLGEFFSNHHHPLLLKVAGHDFIRSQNDLEFYRFSFNFGKIADCPYEFAYTR